MPSHCEPAVSWASIQLRPSSEAPKRLSGEAGRVSGVCVLLLQNILLKVHSAFLFLTFLLQWFTVESCQIVSLTQLAAFSYRFSMVSTVRNMETLFKYEKRPL